MAESTDILIVGGGLAGLALADRLQRAGRDFRLVEARDGFGGRARSERVGRARYDLGPSWFWPGQPHVAELVRRLMLPVFRQPEAGAGLFETAEGAVHRGAGFASMAGALRIGGGVAALAEGLAGGLDPARLRRGAAAVGLRDAGERVEVVLDDGGAVSAGRVVLAIPPRLVAALEVAPVFEAPVRAALEAIPTWMAGQAKLVAVYAAPFWREDGLSGDAFSQRGPLAEIHDASDPAEGGALFGFVGVPAAGRGDREALMAAAVAQLARLFGPAAAAPVRVILQDWAAEPATATAADAVAPGGHPAYGVPPRLETLWDGRLLLGSSEAQAGASGGLVEGALARAADLAARLGG